MQIKDGKPQPSHEPVMLDQVLQLLRPTPGARFMDLTVGAGGHAFAIASRLQPGGRLLGLDHDPVALALASQRLASFGSAIELQRANFTRAADLASAANMLPLQGILADLGVSSMQLDQPTRGFSFSSDGPLDMRMDPGLSESAQGLLSRLDEASLGALLRRYGEERQALRIARAIKASPQPLCTTRQLADLVERVAPRRAAAGGHRIHPATRTFQAIRIAVNGELDALEQLLEVLPSLLAPGGRAAIISFHSLEDRLVKRRLVRWSTGCTCPPDLPVCGCHGQAVVRLVCKKALRPEPEELRQNPRARSARLRVVEKIGDRAERAS